MKQFLVTALFILSVATSLAGPKNRFSATNGIWNLSSNWNLNRLPANGDTVLIPANATVTVNADVSLNNVRFIVYGTINIVNVNTLINLDYESEVIVYAGGTIVGNQASEKIRIGGNQVYKGNDPAVTGPAMATVASVGFIPVVLPVKFIGFTLTAKGDDVVVLWSTAEEINTSVYEVERSFDAANWTKLGSLKAAGNTNTVSTYSFTDNKIASGLVYYRIKEVDKSGAYFYTPVKQIKVDANTQISIGSGQSKIILQFPTQIKNHLLIRILSVSGQVVQERQIQNAYGLIVLNSRLKGHYIVVLSNGQNINLARQIIL